MIVLLDIGKEVNKGKKWKRKPAQSVKVEDILYLEGSGNGKENLPSL